MVPLDGSTLAEQALPLAMSIALRTGARMVLVRVIPSVVEPLFFEDSYLSPEQVTEQMTESAQRYLSGVQQKVQSTLPSQDTEVHVEIRKGPAGPTLADSTAQDQVDLIVMSSHGRSGFSRWSLGSVADQVRRLSRVPMIVLRPSNEDEVGLETLPTLQRILVTLDGSSLAERVLTLAGELAYLFDAELLLFRAAVLPPAFYASPDLTVVEASLWLGMQEEAARYLEEVAGSLTTQGHRVRCVVARDRVPETILKVAEEHDVSLIAMTTHGRTGLSRLLLGSVADRVGRESHRPVLLVRPPLE
jgi:nucleotide-binding universal stress UspA family protein